MSIDRARRKHEKVIREIESVEERERRAMEAAIKVAYNEFDIAQGRGPEEKAPPAPDPLRDAILVWLAHALLTTSPLLVLRLAVGDPPQLPLRRRRTGRVGDGKSRRERDSSQRDQAGELPTCDHPGIRSPSCSDPSLPSS